MIYVNKTTFTSSTVVSLGTDPWLNCLQCGTTGQGVMSLLKETDGSDEINNFDATLMM